ncbi:MAG TPA: transglycosylase SLT domain-containing protein [Longimicrobiales bacterium]|nr:transglycosylase SLT domain-containing protein [Longimicrobiales bacterium]
MAEPGPGAPGALSRPGATPILIAILLSAGGCAGFAPAGPRGPLGEELEDEIHADGSVDGGEAPAGMEELFGGEEPGSSDGATEPAPPALDEELRVQFGAVFLGPRGEVPEAVVEEVGKYIGYFHAGRARENYERWLTREGRYRDLILAELRAQGLPEELLYLTMVESGFSPVAVSRAKAVGLWQFMRTTGRAEGLRIDDWVDERRDPLASTRAAVAHLKMLHRELGDWSLAAAAYNAGLGRVRRARARTAGGYFDLTAAGALPAETRSYVPLILAAGHVAANRERYGLGHVRTEEPLVFDTVRVQGRTRLSAVAKATGVDVAELKALNPHLLRGAAPPGRGWLLRLPSGTVAAEGLAGRAALLARVASLPVEERLLPEYREVRWTVRSGDSWWRIARAHGTTVAAMRSLNPGVGDVIQPGMKLLVARQVVSDDAPPASRAAPTRHRVAAGETLTGLARRYGVSLDDLVAWNDLGSPRPLRIGEVLVVRPDPSASGPQP